MQMITIDDFSTASAMASNVDPAADKVIRLDVFKIDLDRDEFL